MPAEEAIVIPKRQLIAAIVVRDCAVIFRFQWPRPLFPEGDPVLVADKCVGNDDTILAFGYAQASNPPIGPFNLSDDANSVSHKQVADDYDVAADFYE